MKGWFTWLARNLGATEKLHPPNKKPGKFNNTPQEFRGFSSPTKFRNSRGVEGWVIIQDG